MARRRRAKLRPSGRNIVVNPNRPTFQNMVMSTMRLPGIPVTLTTTVTTGVIASELAFNPNSGVFGVDAFSRFTTVFREYRVGRVSVELIPLALNVGVSAFMISDVSIGTPTNLEAFTQEFKLVKNNEQKPNNLRLRWRNEDYSDASYVLTGTNKAVAYLESYTDNANYGSPTAVTALWLVRPVYEVQFRGLSSS